MTANTEKSIVAFATKGTGTNEESRLRMLLSGYPVQFLPYSKARKRKSLIALFRWLAMNRADLLVMEGTGIAGGLPCIVARLLKGQHYVVSSGDAVGPLVGAILPIIGPLFGLYERLLCRLASGYIGWTPYLVGRALTFGTPRAMTAPGWCDALPSKGARERIRAQFNIDENAIVFGIVGSLVWSRRMKYCYGRELVEAAAVVDRPDLHVLIVGDGDGLPQLRSLAEKHATKITFTGNVPADKVVDYMAAMDVGSLPQSVDGVGSFRYTTKLSEYLAAGLPIVTGQIPLSYDLDGGWLWRLPGDAPWSKVYTDSLANLMQTLSQQDLEQRRFQASRDCPTFNKDTQVRAANAFISDILDRVVTTTAAKQRPALSQTSRSVSASRALS